MRLPVSQLTKADKKILDRLYIWQEKLVDLCSAINLQKEVVSGRLVWFISNDFISKENGVYSLTQKGVSFTEKLRKSKDSDFIWI